VGCIFEVECSVGGSLILKEFIEIFSDLVAETKDRETPQTCTVCVKLLKYVCDFDRKAANWQ
jgi:hypothetical protein